MKRSEKEQMVKELSDRFKKAELTILADYCGLTVAEVTNLRRSLRDNQAEMKVVKNTLAQRAVEDTELVALKTYFAGTTAVITASGDPVAPAKALVKFSKEVEKLKIRVGMLSGKVLDHQQIDALSKLPSREELLSKLLGSLMSPPQKLVNALTGVSRKLVYALAAVRDKKQS